MAFVAMINESSGAVEPQAAYGDEWGYLEGIHVSASADTPYGHGPTGTAIRENRPYWCQQFMEDPGTLPWRDRCPDGPPWGSAAALPLRRAGHAVGALTLYMHEPGAFDEETQRLLAMMVNDVSFALDHFAREAAGRRVQQEADATRAQLEATIDAMPNLIFEVGLDGRFYNYHSPRVDLLAVPPDAFLGRTIHETMPPAVVGKLEAALDEAHRTGYSTGISYDLELSGGTRWFDLSIARKRVTDGEAPRFIAVVRDVTTARAAEAERAHLEAQLRHSQKLEALGQLAGGLAHDLNNVLTPILINTPLVRDVVADPAARELLDTTEQCARRGADIIRRLLTFARGAPGERKPVSVAEVCRDMAKIARETFARNIVVRVAVADDVWAIQGDLTQIHQVLMNLCVNARDAMPEGGTLTLEAGNVTVAEPPQDGTSPARPGPFVRIRVRDTGTGMTPAQIEHIFEPFYTTKPIGKGSGLGLPTVRGIVRSHGGFVEVDSTPGEGTAFAIHFLPAVAQVAAAVAEPTAPRRGRGELVLVVDDEATIRSSVRRSLLAQGYTVIVAGDGREGADVFGKRAAEVRVVVSDMMMPVMDGLALLAAVREARADVPFILMSGLLDRATPRGGQPPDVVLSKPFEPEALLAAVGRLCGD
jgi:signal transduction histidine kinase